MAISSDFKKKLIIQFGHNEKNTGSSASQIAILTAEINSITNHVKNHKKDFSSKRGLYKKVQKRTKLLSYLQKHDIDQYRTIIKDLKIRK